MMLVEAPEIEFPREALPGLFSATSSPFLVPNSF
jgi:hypothetical protein